MEYKEENQQASLDMKQAKAPKKEKLTRKERRLRWKAARKARREEQKEYYRYAPALIRWWALYLWKPAVVILAAVILCVALFEPVYSFAVGILRLYVSGTIDKPLSEEQIPMIYELSPIDEEGARKIAAYPAVGEDETWTICVYLVGADLEDADENDLSYVTRVLAEDAQNQNHEQRRESRFDHLMRFENELKENDLDLPEFFYYPERPVASSVVVTEEVTVADRIGAATVDIDEMTAEVWSDNISIVIQTGGATRWSNNMVNPNRTQRFLYRSGEFREVADLPLSPASEPETLAEFLSFCKNEYPADHTMLVLWNHGDGPFGYGLDSICGNMFSLKDLRAALSEVYTPDREDPAFDIIGFDACMMSTLEVTHALDGFAEFYCLSEESEPGGGWDYAPVLQAMTEDAAMSPASVAQKVADSYMDYYMRQNINQFFYRNDVTFSVIEARKAAELYDAYGDLCRAQLTDAVENMGVLAEIGRCADRSTRYAGSDYNIFNLIDLGNYIDQLADSYPEECSHVKELIGESVLYHRENGGLSDSTGIAVYVPSDITTSYGLIFYLDYIYDICEDDAVKALYYYKQAGCLPGELKASVAEISGKEPKTLDTTVFRNFTAAEPEFDDVGFLLPVSEQLQDLIADYELEIGRYDEASDTLTYYGRDDCLMLDGEGHLASEFDGRWICLDGQPLSLEVVSSAPFATEYRARVLYNGEDAYLELSCDLDTEEVRITGVRKVPQDNDVNFLSNTRGSEEIKFGAKITPVYLQDDFSTDSLTNVNGKQITFGRNTSVQMEMLPEGQYLSTAVIQDPRGDSYYSAVITSTLEKGEMKGWQVDTRFFARDYY